ncbi:MAG: hypothetical protein LBU65_07505 [Planctomycetaceae bacterium]|nr:hypothetical protein [Planctomycetaceae bacterium]
MTIFTVFFVTGCLIVYKIQNLYYWYKKITFRESIPEKWLAEPIKYLIRSCVDEPEVFDFVVYIDYQDDINWATGDTKQTGDETDKQGANTWKPSNIEWVLTEVSSLEMSVTNWDTDIRFQVNRLLGEIIVKAFCSQPKEGIQKTLEETKNFILAKKAEVSRMWIIRYAFLTTCLCFAGAIVAFYWSSSLLWLLAGIGCVGAFYSILMRLGKFNYDSMSEKRAHFYEAASRIVVGGISGLVSLWVIKAGIILPTFFNESNEASLLLFAFVAGASERLLPGIISVVENTNKKETIQ